MSYHNNDNSDDNLDDDDDVHDQHDPRGCDCRAHQYVDMGRSSGLRL